jgi:hypothetical protein
MLTGRLPWGQRGGSSQAVLAATTSRLIHPAKSLNTLYPGGHFPSELQNVTAIPKPPINASTATDQHRPRDTRTRKAQQTHPDGAQIPASTAMRVAPPPSVERGSCYKLGCGICDPCVHCSPCQGSLRCMYWLAACMAGKAWVRRCHRPLAIFWACGRVKPPAGQPGKLQGCALIRVVQDGVLIGGNSAPGPTHWW